LLASRLNTRVPKETGCKASTLATPPQIAEIRRIGAGASSVLVSL